MAKIRGVDMTRDIKQAHSEKGDSAIKAKQDKKIITQNKTVESILIKLFYEMLGKQIFNRFQ